MKEDDVLEVMDEIKHMAKAGELVRVISVSGETFRVKTIHGEIMNIQPSADCFKTSKEKWPGEKNEAEIKEFRAARKKAREAEAKTEIKAKDEKTSEADPAV